MDLIEIYESQSGFLNQEVLNEWIYTENDTYNDEYDALYSGNNWNND